VHVARRVVHPGWPKGMDCSVMTLQAQELFE
jgi:hypothetical protein